MERLGKLDVIKTTMQERYSRHILLKEIGEKGQEKIKQAKVLVVGAGGLGSPILLYLAAAGIGTLGFMDDDHISESNLQRQVLYDTGSIGKMKVEVAEHKLKALNPGCHLIAIPHRLTAQNAIGIIEKYDIVVDATDNLSSRYLINDACMETGKPFVYGSICEFKGQISVFNYQGGPNYRDLYPYHEKIAGFQQPSGVIGALPGTIGSIQAAETLKIILESKTTLSGKLLLVDLLEGSFKTLQFI